MGNSYDDLIYSSLPRPESQPGHLASIAKLFGVNAVPLKQARVLELGCGTGGNLIPLAELWPESKFLGIDLSSKQIELGRKIIHELGFKNIELRKESISDFPIKAGEFDYIICHGVFSWVSTKIQDCILDILSKHLSKDGIAYISYNTLPGWRMKGAIREMMLYHTKNIEEPEEKVQQAKVLLKFIADSQPDSNDPYSQTIHKSFHELQSAPSSYLFHEYLEEENQAFYFHEFLARLEPKKLAYVADAQFSLMSHVDLPAETQISLSNISDRFKLEQYLDFIRNRRLRESIICRQATRITYPANTTLLADFYVSAEFIGESVEDNGGGVETSAFTTVKGGEIRTSNIFLVTALRNLEKLWPSPIQLCSLGLEVLTALGIDPKEPEAFSELQNLEEQIFLFFSANLLELELNKCEASGGALNKPRASAYARKQALSQDRITSLRHQAIQFEPIVLQILSLLDGKTSISELVQKLLVLSEKGDLIIEKEEKKVSQTELKEFFAGTVKRSIDLLAKHSFLFGPST